jgi:hypothetical protein
MPTYTLLPETICATGHVLTYQVRPIQAREIVITFILSGTSAGAGDTLDITGTDENAVEQTESIDVSAGDDSYTGVKTWRTITNIDCTGWSDGTLTVTQDKTRWPSKRIKGSFYTVNQALAEEIREDDLEIDEIIRHIVKSGILQSGRG